MGETTILLMEEILLQLRLVVYPIVYRVLYIPSGAVFVPSTVSSRDSLPKTSLEGHTGQVARRPSCVAKTWGIEARG